ncbi:MAG TPA: SMC-Scp complex subunit ScpB [Anaerolineae bacterium]|nr:SMC-Scp complex subunit ScpB [Anaerolineae bacterium]HQJ12241.1 SMC-Scp complex subunit ScpB [Anaerolineae bacterium]HUM36164.1 SMC-Scp complex subunit ScpB [Anaerolineae bacterium]
MSESQVLTPVALIEALLFVAQGPVKEEDLFAAAALSEAEGREALARLETYLAGGGLRLQHLGRRLQLVTAPQAAPQVEHFLGLEVNLRLSQAAVETLAIVAYAQPVTRPQVEAVRGVNSDSVLRTLLAAGLIEEAGRADTVGRPILYQTTFEFLQQFGLSNLQALPALEAMPQNAAPGASTADEA